MLNTECFSEWPEYHILCMVPMHWKKYANYRSRNTLIAIVWGHIAGGSMYNTHMVLCVIQYITPHYMAYYIMNVMTVFRYSITLTCHCVKFAVQSNIHIYS